MTNKHDYLLFLLLFFSLATKSQSTNQAQFHRFSTEAGLSHNDIQYLYQDSYGFIWIGTNHGLNRFDGYEFKKFYAEHEDSTSLASNDVTVIWEDSLRHIWVANSYDGISRFHRETATFEHFLKGKIINDIYQESPHTVLLAINDGKGLWRFNMLTGESHQVFEQKMTTAYHSHLSIGMVLKDQQGKIWFGDGSLFQYDESQNKLRM